MGSEPSAADVPPGSQIPEPDGVMSAFSKGISASRLYAGNKLRATGIGWSNPRSAEETGRAESGTSETCDDPMAPGRHFGTPGEGVRQAIFVNFVDDDGVRQSVFYLDDRQFLIG